jgi:hypothetical protein
MKKPEKQIPWLRYIFTAIGLLVLSGGYFIASIEHKVTITQEQVQVLLDDKIPELLATHPKISFLEPPQIVLQQNSMTLTGCGSIMIGSQKVLTATLPEKDISMCLATTGDPDLRGSKLYFLATDFTFDRLLIDGEAAEQAIGTVTTELQSSATRQVGALLTNDSVTGFLEGFGINIDQDRVKSVTQHSIGIARDILVKYQEPAEAKLQSLIVDTLHSTALYDINDHEQGWLVMAALKDIGVENGEISATLSGLQVITTILTLLLVSGIILIIVYGMVRSDSTGILLFSGTLGGF